MGMGGRDGVVGKEAKPFLLDKKEERFVPNEGKEWLGFGGKAGGYR